jgi:glycosyltransferase involved in cell wall biosynthesis
MLPLAWPDAGLGLMRAAAALPCLVLFHLAAEGDAPEGAAELAPALGLEQAAIAAVSAPVAARAARAFGLPEARVAILPNPAPRPAPIARDVARAVLRGAIGVAADGPLVLFVGRLEEAKGAELLPEVSARLKVPLACLGDGPLRGLLQARAAGDPRGLLRILGPVADPAPWYRAADALLLPSRLEGAPLVFLEAAAHRLPVIATAAALEALGADAPRMARISEPTATALATAVEETLADAAGSVMRVEAAAAHAASLDWDGTMDGLAGLLRGAATSRRPEAA